MEWTPSKGMTVPDLRAVLLSWGVFSLSSDKKELGKLVAKHYTEVMMQQMSKRSSQPSAAASSSSGTYGINQGVGTDEPQVALSFIGDDDSLCEEVNKINLDKLIVNKMPAGKPANAEYSSAACASAAAPEEVDFINVFGRKDELEYEQSAACAGEDTPGDDPLPSLRKSVAKAKAKHNAKANKKNGKKDDA